MDGRDEDQQQESLRNRTEGGVGGSRDKLEKDGIGRRILLISSWRCSTRSSAVGNVERVWTRSREQSELFLSAIIVQLGDQACFHPADETVAF